MQRVDKTEYEKRVRLVMEWILDDFTSTDIVKQICLRWAPICERQAKRYIAEARKRWFAEQDLMIEQKRRLKVESLKKLKRSLKDSFKGTPEGIRAILSIENSIIDLEGLAVPKLTKTATVGEDGKIITPPPPNITLVLPPGIDIDLPENLEE